MKCSKCGDSIVRYFFGYWRWYHVKDGIMGKASLSDYERHEAAGCSNQAVPADSGFTKNREAGR